MIQSKCNNLPLPLQPSPADVTLCHPFVTCLPYLSFRLQKPLQMFVLRYIYMCVGCVGRGGLYIPIYMFIYVCACVCVYTHALLPPVSVVGKRLSLRLPPQARSFRSKEPVWLLFNRSSTILLNAECSTERYGQGARKLFPAA